jgi:SAM-dependent methyltransferase
VPEQIDYGVLDEEEWPQAVRLAEYLALAFERRFVIDVGCGPGTYVRAMRGAGILAVGIDVDPRAAAEPHCTVMDACAGPWEGGAFDALVSLEVAEHVPPEDTAALFRFYRSCRAPVVYFSAARPGQGGVGHVNCRERREWVALWREHGYAEDEAETARWLGFMRAGPHMGWLLQNGTALRRVHR